jgi:hypothetical protein
MDKKWIVVDLDGTLCDCSHRVHLAQAGKWNEFYAGIPSDKISQPIANLVTVMEEAGYQILICTGRDETHRNITTDWLIEKGLAPIITNILMRPKNDFKTPDHVIKIQTLHGFFGSPERARESVLFTLDDRDRVVEAWRNAGFVCLQVQAGAY